MTAPIYLLSAKDNACVKVADPLPSSCYLRPESVKSGLTVKSNMLFRPQNPWRKVVWIRTSKTLSGLGIIAG